MHKLKQKRVTGVANYSLFDAKDIEFSREFPKNYHLITPYKNQKEVIQLIKIAAGWYIIEEVNGELFFVDLRFGQMGMDINKAPFIWRYKLIPDEKGQIRVERARQDFGKSSAGSVFSETLEPHQRELKAALFDTRKFGVTGKGGLIIESKSKS